MRKKTVITNPIVYLLALFLCISWLPGLQADELALKIIPGTYTRETENESARIKISLLPNGKVHVTGMAFWGTQREYGPNMGELDFTAAIRNGHITHTERDGQEPIYTLELTFADTGLTAREEGSSYNFGLNVSFAGDYRKASP